MPTFRFSPFYNSRYYNNHHLYNPNNLRKQQPSENNKNNAEELKAPQHSKSIENSKSDNYFFELFGLKLYFDDVLLICLMFFLYEEGIKDNELFLSLALLLLS